MRALTVWSVGTAYVLAAIAGAAVVVWAADHEDNSANPTHWSVGAAILLTPIVLAGLFAVSKTWTLQRMTQGRRTILAVAAVAAAVAAVLVIGANEVIADANACGDDDCVTLSIPLAVACVLGAWSLPLGLSMLRRWRYPAPWASVGMLAALTTLVTGLAAVVQRTAQEDDYADVELGTALLVWVLPAMVAVVAVARLCGPSGDVVHRTDASQIWAGYLAAVGSWFIALPFVADVDSDALPIVLAVAAIPGAILLIFGLMALLYRPRVGGRQAP